MKAVFVDRASLIRMMQSHGVDRINYKQLLAILRTEVGTTAHFRGKPVITVPTTATKAFVDYVQKVGFEVISVDSHDGQDDHALMERMEQVDPHATSSIVFVGCDADYLPLLRRKAARGITVYMVATRIPQEDGRSSVGDLVEQAVEKGEIRFFELSLYADQLRAAKRQEEPKVETSANAAALPPNGLRFVLELTGASHTDYMAITNEVLELQQRYPGMVKARIEK